MSDTTYIDTKNNLDSVVIAMQTWRNNNKNKKIQQPIPLSIWHQVFTLTETHAPCTIRKLLGISKAQYDKKFAELFPTQQPTKELLSKKAVTVVEFCQVNSPKVADTPPIEINSAIKNKPHYEELPKYIGVNTVIVEFCRADGKIMKIHTTSHCFQEIIDSFYNGVADVTDHK